MIPSIHQFTALVSMLTVTAVSLAQTTPSPSEVVEAANMLGLSSDSLASLDVTSSEVDLLLDRLQEEYDQFEQLLSIQENMAEALVAEAESNAVLRHEPSDPEALAALSQAQLDISNAASSVEFRRQSIFSDVLAGLADSSLINALLLQEGSIAHLPAPYRLAVATSEDATTLLWALKMQTLTNSSGGTLPSEAAQALNNAMSQTDVNLALIRVQQHQAGIEAAINAWAASN
jgi:hypothetical protein